MVSKLEYDLKHNRVVQKGYTVIFSFLFRLLHLFIKVDKKQILFQSLIGKSFGDSPRVLYDAIKNNPNFREYKFIWAFDEPEKFRITGAKTVKLTSIQYYIEALKSGIWISNVSIERGLKFKPAKTIYINTWHGIPIKVIGNAQKARNDYDYSTVDFMCCSSEFEKRIFERDFKVKSDCIIKCGMPRNDELYHPSEEISDKVKTELGIDKTKKIILYAPTWRDSKDGGNSYQIAPPMDLNYWKSMIGDEYVLFFRMHHLTTQLMGVEFNDFVVDVSKYPEINKLLFVSDILISDYSATIFDFSILERPIISFAYDLEEYAESRGFYENLEKDVLSGDVFRTEKEVLNHIKTMDYQKECEKARKIKHKYVEASGHATDACINYLLQKIKN